MRRPPTETPWHSSDVESMNAAGLRHIALAVADFAGTYARLKEKGVRFLTDAQTTNGNSLAFFRSEKHECRRITTHCARGGRFRRHIRPPEGKGRALSHRCADHQRKLPGILRGSRRQCAAPD